MSNEAQSLLVGLVIVAVPVAAVVMFLLLYRPATDFCPGGGRHEWEPWEPHNFHHNKHRCKRCGWVDYEPTSRG